MVNPNKFLPNDWKLYFKVNRLIVLKIETMPTIPRTQEDYQNDNILSGLNWDAVDRELLRGSLPVFEDESEMRAFYQKLALLFCPEARNFPEDSYLRLVLYRRKISKINHWLGKVLRFPWGEDMSLLQLGVGYALMDSTLSSKNKKQLNTQWCKSLCYMKDMNENLTFIRNIISIFSRQKYELALLIGPYLPTSEEEALLNAPKEQPEDLQKAETV